MINIAYSMKELKVNINYQLKEIGLKLDSLVYQSKI